MMTLPKNIYLLIVAVVCTAQTASAQGNDKLIELGVNAFDNERYVEAIDFFTKVLYPIGVEDNVGYDPYEIRTNSRAIEKDSNNVLLPPQDPTNNEKIVIHKMAEAYRKLNDYESAEVWFKKALNYPMEAFPYTRYFYAETMMQNHKYDAAQKEFHKFMTGDVVNRDNKYFKLSQTKIASCEFAKDPHNTTDKYKVVQADSIVNFSATAYAMRQFAPNYFAFSALPSTNEISNLIDSNDARLLNIYIVEMTTDGIFGVPEKLPFSINTSGRHQGSMAISPDGKRIYFTRVNPLNRADTRIFYAEKKDNVWQLPQPLNEFVNAKGFKSFDPYLTKDGKQLFFASDMPGGEGGADIWVAALDENGRPTSQQNLGFNVNTPEDETSPFAHEASKALYYASKGGIGFGGFDIFISKWDYSSDWYKKGYNVGAPVNSSRDDSHFIIDDILEDGFLTSDRDQCLNCGENATRIEFCNKLYSINKDVLSFAIEGYVFDEETGLPLKGATVEFKDIAQANEPLWIETDEHGYYKFILEPEMDYFGKATMIDYFADQALISTADELVSKTFQQNFYLKPIPKGEVAIEGIEYDYDKATLRPVSIEILDKLVEFLELNDNLSVEIRSHTDYRGSDSYNMKLSDARAKSVVDYLIAQGIAYERLKPKGYGETTPAEIENEEGEIVTLNKAYIDALPTELEREEAHQRNRRTAFKVLGQ